MTSTSPRPTSPNLSSPPPPTLYLGYGSNLWLSQMSLRCPTSTPLGLGRLPSHRWIISARGYANIIPTDSPSSVVYGMIYALTPTDEARLDANEGVPFAYTKEVMSVDFWPAATGGKSDAVGGQGAEKRKVLVYIDRVRVEEGVPRAEYVHRMNMGIKDGVERGLSVNYVDEVLRKFVPVEGKKGMEVEELARRQAVRFEDEG